MIIEMKKRSSPFWEDSLTKIRYPTESHIPKHIPKRRVNHFASLLEYSCYQNLRLVFSDDSIFRQAKLNICPRKYPFPPINWTIDFLVEKNNHNFYVECKGGWISRDKEALANFIKLLRFVSYYREDVFRNLIIVSDKNFSLGNTKIKVISFNDLRSNFAA